MLTMDDFRTFQDNVRVQAPPSTIYVRRDSRGIDWKHGDLQKLRAWVADKDAGYLAADESKAQAVSKAARENPPLRDPVPQPPAKTESPETPRPPTGDVVLTGQDGTSMGSRRVLKTWETSGIPRDKIRVPTEEKITYRGEQGRKMAEEINAALPGSEKVPAHPKRTLDDPDKIYVTVVGPTEAKRHDVVKEFTAQGGKLFFWKDKINLIECGPEDWRVKDVGLPSGGDPTVVIQVADLKNPYKGQVVRAPEWDSVKVAAGLTEAESILRKRDPHFDPTKIPQDSLNWYEWIQLGNLVRNTNLVEWIGGAVFGVAAIFVLVIGGIIAYSMISNIPDKSAT